MFAVGDLASASGILKSERGLSHRKPPDGKLQACNHRQFGVTAHWRRKTVSVQQESIPAEFREGMLPSRLETPRSVPVKGDRAMAIFFLTITPAPKCVYTPSRGLSLRKNLVVISFACGAGCQPARRLPIGASSLGLRIRRQGTCPPSKQLPRTKNLGLHVIISPFGRSLTHPIWTKHPTSITNFNKLGFVSHSPSHLPSMSPRTPKCDTRN